MARKNLSSMLSVVDDQTDTTADQAPTPVEAPASGEVEASTTSKPDPAHDPAERTADAKTSKAPRETVEPVAETVPRYLELTRKEARFTDDQLESLSVLTRQLNKARRGSGERITDNTLIRVAVDLLLQRAGDLAGTDESELRHSVGL